MLRIGITQRVQEIQSYGERRDCLDQEWSKLLWTMGYCPIVLPNTISEVGNYITCLQLDGLILSGGNDLAIFEGGKDVAPERDAFEKQLLDFAKCNLIPTLGVCRGMQMLLAYYQANLIEVQCHVATEHSLKVMKSSHMPIPEEAVVNSYHNYGISIGNLPGEFTCAAVAEDETVEAVCHQTLPQWGIMWHPERSPSSEFNRDIISSLFQRTGGSK